MKILFVCSGNSKSFEIVPFIKEQGEALKMKGIQVDYFPVIGKGIIGYIKAGLRLRNYLRTTKYDIIHAHYTLSGWAAKIGAGKTPIVLSLMGDDAYGTYIGVNKVSLFSRFFTILTFLIQPFTKAIISKSNNIERFVYLKRKSHVIPNGIDLKKFKPEPSARIENKEVDKKKVLFLGNKTNVRKNYTLAAAALAKLNLPDVELVNPYPVSHHEVPALLNQSDVLVVPSLMEGSPNIVKEAMACNCPIVATDIGDVKWVLGETEGCFVSSFDEVEFAEKLKAAIRFSEAKGRTKGIERIKELGLDADSVAKRIINVYQAVLQKN